ncbi:MAG: hypothetical protein LC115_10585 [Bacteroidia bacterium]|nr:hypothetical protein [Bacteroidia bacterium]
MSKRKKKIVSPELNDFQISVNQFGEITSTMDISAVNQFLDTSVDDKKFRGVQVVRRSEKDSNSETANNS